MTTGRPYRQQLLGILWPELCLVLWKLGLHFVNEESGALLGADGEGGGDENSQREDVPFQKLFQNTRFTMKSSSGTMYRSQLDEICPFVQSEL